MLDKEIKETKYRGDEIQLKAIYPQSQRRNCSSEMKMISLDQFALILKRTARHLCRMSIKVKNEDLS